MTDEEKLEEYYNMGRARLQDGDTDKAIEILTEAVKFAETVSASDWADSYRSRGYVYYTKKEYDKAIADFSEAIRIFPNPEYYKYRGNVYLDTGDNNQCIADITEALRMVDEFYSQHKDDASIASQDQALKSDWAEYYNIRGVAYLRMEDYNLATSDFEAALALDPNVELYRDNLALATKGGKEGFFARFWKKYRRRISIGAGIGAAIAIWATFSSGNIRGIADFFNNVVIVIIFAVAGGVAGFILPFIGKAIKFLTQK